MTFRAVVFGLVVATTACSKGAESPASSSETQSSLGTCVSGKAVDVDGLSIRGAAGASPGDVVTYALNEDLSCSPGQTVSWKSLNTRAVGDGQVFTASFRRPGSYVVAAQVQSADATTPTEVSYKTVVSAALEVSGPQVGMAFVENTFALVIPTGVTVTTAKWTYDDGSAPVANAPSVKHAFQDVGAHALNVTVTLSTGEVQTLSHRIQVIPVREGFECVNQLALSGATSVPVNTSAALSVYVPSCLTTRVTAIKWTFGDGGQGADQSVQHAYAAIGSYPVTVGLFSAQGATPFVTLQTTMNVTAVDVGVDPPVVDQNQCATMGMTRQTTGELYTKEVSCGVGGTRVNSYRDLIEERCQKPAGLRVWAEVSRTQELVSEGACQGQSCEVPAASAGGGDLVALSLVFKDGRYYLPHGSSKTFYSTNLPAGACAEVAAVRSCVNGVLGGSTTAVHAACQAGCAGIGPHGSQILDQVTGQESVAKVCAFGETGIFDQFATLSTKACANGMVVVSNPHRGDLVTAGTCPVYALGGTDQYGACSADCGGVQNQIFACRDVAGLTVPGERCVGQTPPLVQRVCDGNPAAAVRTESTTTSEEGGQSRTCPTNQIGIVVQSRDRISTDHYACVDHAIQKTETTVAYGEYTSQNFCRDYVAYRCSQDSLSNDQSIARYQWMQKCADQVPVIKDFLTQFEDYQAGTDARPYLLFNHRMVYATFMNRATSPEKVWKAPVKATASCEVPATVYIAAVCTASCATPDQQILAGADAKLAYAPIGTAWAQQFRSVATLAGSSLDGKKVSSTPVDQWVTELVDGTHDILGFRLKSGGVLRLTPNHPVVTAQGSIKLARDFTVGESLVKLGGGLDPIVGIDHQVHEGKVINVFVKSADPLRNVVVTNGYLNGTAYFQNEGAQNVNKKLFRTGLVNGVIK